jgi:hypothetical protein
LRQVFWLTARVTRTARDLASLLSGLPLALEQAAAYMQATGHPGRLPGPVPAAAGRAAGPGEPTGYDKTVASTWALPFDRVQAAPDRAGLLRLLASCAPEAIPLRLLLQPRPG